VLLADSECNGDRLDKEVGALLDDPERLEAMGQAARAVARPDAADRLADLVEQAASLVSEW
jgi:UDP-N-acetylglucosamine--N-acetylmuramyl-(pentapeptide) pyrophosphoryl-undecaprenol N-acetylglucosamine transferase